MRAATWKSVAASVGVIALTVATTPTSQAAISLDYEGYNGAQSCISIDSNGNVKAPQPGECAQFGKGGQGRSDEKAKNVIMIVGDGMGHQEITAARNYLLGAGGRFDGLDNLTATGAYTTFAIDQDGKKNYVTDSAASATGWATGTKSYNGALGVDIQKKAHINLLEMAKNSGMRTGNVTTSEIQDATPASMGSHISQRGYYAPSGDAKPVKGSEARENGGIGSISEQLIDTRADVTLGGGAKYFDTKVMADSGNTNPFLEGDAKFATTWEKDKTVAENAEANGYKIVRTRDELAAVTEANQDQPVLGLFHDKNMTRRFESSTPTKGGATAEPTTCTEANIGNEPELADMTKKAIELLDKPNEEKGFFLQVESASIDKADHAADACGFIGELKRLEDTVATAVDFAKKDGDTLVVVTADHAHTAQIVPDGKDSPAVTTRLHTHDDTNMSVAFGTVPVAQVESGDFSMQHTGTQVRIAAYGPASENVFGQIDQTDAFYVMANALGLGDWKVNSAPVVRDFTARSTANGDLCYQLEAGKAPQVGDCAKFGKTGQGLDNNKAKNVVIMLADGTADADITAARNYLHGASGRFEAVDNLEYTGYHTTYSLDKETGKPDYVTDSAASGSSLYSGIKTYNGALGIDNNGKPVPTMAELAKAAGMKVGNVSTAEIQDATPAAFAVHALDRADYAPSGDKKVAQDAQRRENGGLGSISEQLVDVRADVTLGGGARYFDTEVMVDGKNGETTWTKGKTVLDNARDNGFEIVTDANGLDAVQNSDKPVLGLFSPSHMPRIYKETVPTEDGAMKDAQRCEANPEYTDQIPTLAAMTRKSLELLQNDKGFVLHVEAASPDKASHGADACGMIGEIRQWDESIKVVQDWVEETGESTLIVATADHAQTPMITYNNAPTAGLTTKLKTADGADMSLVYSTAKSNDPKDALGGQQHTGAQVRVAASGPGAANFTGQIDETDIFFAAMNAVGVDTEQDIDLTSPWADDTQETPDNSGSTDGSAKNAGSSIGILFGIIVALLGAAAVLSPLFPQAREMFENARKNLPF